MPSILATQLIGRAQPESPISSYFTNPDGLPCSQPCLLGIRPGFTTYDHFVMILKTHPLTRDFVLRQISLNDESHPQIDLVGSDVEVMFLLNGNEPISYFALYFRPVNWSTKKTPLAPFLVEDVIQTFGSPPDFIIVYPDTMQLRYDSLRFENHITTFDPVRLDPQDPIYLIAVGQAPASDAGAPLTWRGFTALRRYWNDR